MLDAFVLMVALTSAALSGWIYWQVQQRQQRMTAQELELREKTLLISELADELSIASSYLYEAMDQCLARIDAVAEQCSKAAVTPAAIDSRIAAGQPSDAPGPSAAGADRLRGGHRAAPTEGESLSLEPPLNGQTTTVGEPAPTEPVSSEGTPAETISADVDEDPYHPHFHALELATQGMEPMEIVRHTGLGVEELRLLLRFQRELFVMD